MLKIIEHPLIKVKLSHMRNEETSSKDFRELLDETGSLMCYEVFKDLKINQEEETYRTPTGAILHKVKFDREIVLAPILRAGIGLVDGVKNIIPTARVGHIGMFRDEETLEPHEYYFKLPEVKNPFVVVCDPMLATGGSAIAAIEAIKKRNYSDSIRLMCLVGCPEGVKAVTDAHPDVDIYLASLDQCLNERGYILPGLGDAGDRIFGTK